MDSIRFRRPIRAGCEWLQAGWGGRSLARRNDVGLILGGPNLSADGHVQLAVLILTRLVRHQPTRHDSVVLHRAIQHLLVGQRERPDDAALRRGLLTAHLLNDDVDRGLATAEECKGLAPALALEVEIDVLRLGLERGFSDTLGSRYALLESREPDTERFAACLGAYLRVRGRWEDARVALIRAHDRWPSSLIVHLELATTLWASADSTSALYHLSTMFDEHPDWPCTQWNLVAALTLTGDVEAARRQLEASSPSVASDHELLALMERTADRPAEGAPPLSGDLSTVSLADILNLLWNCRSFGTLSIDSAAGTGGLHLWKGRLVGAVAPNLGFPGPSTVTPANDTHGGFAIPVLTGGRREAVYRQVRTALDEMLGWKSGRFEFTALGEASFPDTAGEVALDTPVVLLEAYADLDQKRR